MKKMYVLVDVTRVDPIDGGHRVFPIDDLTPHTYDDISKAALEWLWEHDHHGYGIDGLKLFELHEVPADVFEPVIESARKQVEAERDDVGDRPPCSYCGVKMSHERDDELSTLLNIGVIAGYTNLVCHNCGAKKRGIWCPPEEFGEDADGMG